MRGTDAPVNSENYIPALHCSGGVRLLGKVRQVIGLVVEVSGIRPFIGEICRIQTVTGDTVEAEVVGFKEKSALLMPLGALRGISPGSPVQPTGARFTVRVSDGLLGGVLDGVGRPLDGSSPAAAPGEGAAYAVDNSPPNPLDRRPITAILPTGVKALDSLLTCGEGQRVGIFSGSGVGKSTLLGMIARHSTADVNVIALIGERGREVGDFIARDLGPEGLKRSVVVASTSDRPALERVTGALVAMTVAEYFRDRGKRVVFMMDSVTRFCMAQREIGLTVGEPPSSKGYTPSVFALLARFLERSGTSRHGSITGFFTVLVDGDDFSEPITDAVRSILDGHIILTRKLAVQNHFPALDVLHSNSRLMPHLVDPPHSEAAAEVRRLLAAYAEAEDLISIGAYQRGSRELVDRAVARRDAIMQFLRQKPEERFRWAETAALLQEIAGPAAVIPA